MENQTQPQRRRTQKRHIPQSYMAERGMLPAEPTTPTPQKDPQMAFLLTLLALFLVVFVVVVTTKIKFLAAVLPVLGVILVICGGVFALQSLFGSKH